LTQQNQQNTAVYMETPGDLTVIRSHQSTADIEASASVRQRIAKTLPYPLLIV